MHTTGSDSARAALDTVARTRQEMATKLGNCPPIRHVMFGALFAVLIGTIAISTSAQIMGCAAVIVGVLAIKRWDERRMGVFINGYRKGRTLPVTLGFVGLMILLVAAAMHMRIEGFADASKAGLAAIAFVLGVAFSIVWMRVFRKELRAGMLA